MADTKSTSALADGGAARATAHNGVTIAVVTVPQTTPAAITATKYPAEIGVVLQADSGNAAAVEVGFGVFALGSGIALTAGSSITLYVRDPSMIFAASANANQKLRIAVT